MNHHESFGAWIIRQLGLFQAEEEFINMEIIIDLSQRKNHLIQKDLLFHDGTMMEQKMFFSQMFSFNIQKNFPKSFTLIKSSPLILPGTIKQLRIYNNLS